MEYIETVYSRVVEIAQIWVWGDSLCNFLVGIIVPNFENLQPKLISLLGNTCPEDKTALCADERVKKLMLELMEAAADQAKLLGFQRVKTILLEPNQWTIEGNLLTPTFKIRRTQLKSKYEAQLKQLCVDYQASSSGKSH